MTAPPLPPTLPETGFLRLRDVLRLIPVSKSSWYAGIADGRYPKPIMLAPRSAAYRAEDIRALIARLSSGEASE